MFSPPSALAASSYLPWRAGCAICAPAGIIDDDLRRAAAEHRGELLALLTWDAVAADRERNKVLSIIDGTLSLPWLSPAQRGVLAAMNAVVEMYHASRDPLLFGTPAWIETHISRWRSAHENAIRGR